MHEPKNWRATNQPESSSAATDGRMKSEAAGQPAASSTTTNELTNPVIADQEYTARVPIDQPKRSLPNAQRPEGRHPADVCLEDLLPADLVAELFDDPLSESTHVKPEKESYDPGTSDELSIELGARLGKAVPWSKPSNPCYSWTAWSGTW